MQFGHIRIKHTHGVHTRPAALFVKEASRFHSEVILSSDGTSVNGKSIMGILMLALGPGAEVTISITGEDEQEALKRLTEVLSGSFHEL